MSWSVSMVERPAAVKAALAKHFEAARENTKRIPHESESVSHVEAIVNGQLDFLAGLAPCAVQVTASGSAWVGANGEGSSEVRLEVKQLHGFTE